MKALTDFVFGFQESEIEVNDQGSHAELRHEAALTFCMSNLTTERAVCNEGGGECPSISFTVWVGDGSGNLFHSQDELSDYGTFLCPDGFQASQWEKPTSVPNQRTARITGDESFPIAVDSGAALTFLWTGIRSTAMEGVCRVSVFLSGFGEDYNGTYYYSFIKRLAPLRICWFHSEPSFGSPGDRIRLKWKVENATQGYILPGGYNIFTGGIQSSSTCEVTLTPGVERFYINVSNDAYGAFQSLDVAMPMPRINVFDFDSALGKLSWDAYCGTKRTLMVKTKTKAWEKPLETSAGSCLVDTPIVQATLQCAQGEMMVRKTLNGALDSAMGFFAREELVLKTHTILRARWDLKAATKVTLCVSECSCYQLDFTVPNGEWEMLIIPPNRTVYLNLSYTLSSGESGKLCL